MQLLLWRHAEAEDTLPDMERRLTAHGRHQAEGIAKWLAPRLPDDVRVIASPATRARQTADALKRVKDYEIEPHIAPGAATADILEVIGWPNVAADSSLLLVGHQPWIGRTVAQLLAGREISWSVRKAAVWWLVHRQRSGQGQWTLRSVTDPDQL